MRYFKRLGVILGLLHVVLYFAVPVYGSWIEKLGPAFISLPVMFFFGYWWPVLLFFAFAPRRWHDDPEAQEFIRQIGNTFRIQVAGLPIRIVSLVLLWPFSVMNFAAFYWGLRE